MSDTEPNPGAAAPRAERPWPAVSLLRRAGPVVLIGAALIAAGVSATVTRTAQTTVGAALSAANKLAAAGHPASMSGMTTGRRSAWFGVANAPFFFSDASVSASGFGARRGDRDAAAVDTGGDARGTGIDRCVSVAQAAVSAAAVGLQRAAGNDDAAGECIVSGEDQRTGRSERCVAADDSRECQRRIRIRLESRVAC